MAEYNLIELYRSMFGYRAASHINLGKYGGYAKQDTQREVEKRNDYTSMAGKFTAATNPNSPKSLMGVPIIMPVTLKYYSGGQLIEIEMQEEPIIQIKGSKTIVETKIDGMEGTFKEMYNMNDYQITIQGICITKDPLDENYPQEPVRQLREICEAKVPIYVDNDLLCLFNVTQLAVYEWDFPTIPGENTIQGYELICKSDRQLELEITE